MGERGLPTGLVTVRPARREDADAITALVREAYAEYVPLIGREPAPMTCDYSQVVEAGHTWVAEQDGTVVGVLVLALARTHLLIENLAVATDRQCAGIGALLLRAAEEQALRAGLGQIRLYTNEAMTPNLTYYPRHGYSETHRADQDGYHRVFYAKNLNP